MSSSHFGKLIVIDGGDGAGKGTIMETLKEEYPEAAFTREPGGTNYAESIRDLVLGPLGKQTSPLAQLLAVMSARADHVEKVIRPALEAGKIVFSDRFDSSSWAYQVTQDFSIREIFWTLRQQIVAVPSRIAPWYIFLDVEPEVGLKRRALDRGQQANHFDERKIDFHRQVQEGFLEFGRFNSSTFLHIDANQPKDQVAKKVLELVQDIIS